MWRLGNSHTPSSESSHQFSQFGEWLGNIWSFWNMLSFWSGPLEPNPEMRLVYRWYIKCSQGWLGREWGGKIWKERKTESQAKSCRTCFTLISEWSSGVKDSPRSCSEWKQGPSLSLEHQLPYWTPIKHQALEFLLYTLSHLIPWCKAGVAEL